MTLAIDDTDVCIVLAERNRRYALIVVVGTELICGKVDVMDAVVSTASGSLRRSKLSVHWKSSHIDKME